MFFLKYLINPLIDIIIPFLERILDGAYKQSYTKFYALELIARIPYFSYLSVLHLQQSLGMHPALELLDLHYKETVNEQYHLMIMEELCGNVSWYEKCIFRFVGVLYYFLVLILYVICPTSGYYLMEIVEKYAASSYTSFLNKHEKELKEMVASGFALKYFFSKKGRMTEIDKNGDSKPSLYDVFVSIRNDELVHTSDMKIVGSMSSLYTSHRGSEIVESVLKRGI